MPSIVMWCTLTSQGCDKVGGKMAYILATYEFH